MHHARLFDRECESETPRFMRSVWFALVGASLAEVRDWLQRHGVAPSEGRPGQFFFPSTGDPVLYVTCDDYRWVQEYGLQEEYDELLQAIGGATPTVHVAVDVSGRVPGDREVQYLAQCLLGKFHGFAFDDFLSYSHAWTLAQIDGGVRVGGVSFFDLQVHSRNRSESPPN